MVNSTNYILPLSGITVKNKTEIGVTPLELAELMSANVPIPPGFVITQTALEYFASVNQIDQKVKQLQHMGAYDENTLTKLILESELPKEIYSYLSKEYSAIAGITNIWMRIRAGLFDVNGNPLTFIDESEINEVKGLQALEMEVKKIWAKLLIIDQKYDSLGSFVIVQKLVPAEVAGVVMTQDKAIDNKDHIIVKCLYGEYSSDLDDNADVYVFSKSNEKIIDRSINVQNEMLVRSNKNDFGFETVSISDKWKTKQKLADKFIEDLGYIGDYLENVFTKPQEVTWVFQAGKIWINYVKPLNFEKATHGKIDLENEIEKDLEEVTKVVDQAAEEMNVETVDISMPDENPEVEDINIELNQTVDNKISARNTTEIKDFKLQIKSNSVVKDVLVVGVGNNHGGIEGKVVFNQDEATENDILVMTEWDNMPKNVAGIIIEDFLRMKSDIPTVYGAEMATKILREGEFIKMDTDTGFVYELDNMPKELPIEEENIAPENKISEHKIEKLEDKIEVLESIVEEEVISTVDIVIPTEVVTPEIDTEVKIEIEKPRLPVKPKTIATRSNSKVVSTPEVEEVYSTEKIPTAIKVYCRTSSQYKEELGLSDGFILDLPHISDYVTSLDKIDYKSISTLIYNFTLPFLKSTTDPVLYNVYDTNPSNYIKNSELLQVQCEAVHKLRSREGLRNLYISLPKFKNIRQLRDFRKTMTGSGLRRSSTFKVFIKVAYSSNIFELKTYLEDRFDGVIVSVSDLYNNLYSYNKKNIRLSETLITTLQQIQNDCKVAKVPMILDMKGVKMNKVNLEKISKIVNYGIAILPADINATKSYISKLESSRIFGLK